MRYVNLGQSGLKVSVVSLGSWLTFGRSVEDRTARECGELALEAGVNVIDTADVYNRGEAERVLGELLSGRERRNIVLATKVYFPMSDDVNDQGLSRKHITESIDASLSRLRTDYVDLYQCHRYDEDTPTEEVVRTMGDLIARGKILYWGVSMWPADRIAEACEIADDANVPRPISNQPVYNLLARRIEAEVIPVSLEYGLDQIVFSPLAQGVLTGKYSGGNVPPGSRAAGQDRSMLEHYLKRDNLERVDRLAEIARSGGITVAQLALAWTLHQEGVASAIFGATTPDQVDENIGAADVALDDATLDAIEEIFTS